MSVPAGLPRGMTISPAMGAWKRLARLRKDSLMSKSELITAIHRLNQTAGTDFLSRFGEKDLAAYLARIQQVRLIVSAPYAVQPKLPISARWM